MPAPPPESDPAIVKQRGTKLLPSPALPGSGSSGVISAPQGTPVPATLANAQYPTHARSPAEHLRALRQPDAPHLRGHGSLPGRGQRRTAAEASARWVKVESLLGLQEDRPDVTLVTTANVEENHAMLALNRALGFSPVAVYTNCALQLS